MLTILRAPTLPRALEARLAAWTPTSGLGRVIQRCFQHLPPELAGELLDGITRTVIIESTLSLVHLHGPHSATPGRIDDYGVVSRRVVTTAGVNFLVDAFQNSVEVENMKYHGIGVGTGAEAVGDTALGSELTTEYNPNNTRATGSLTEGASANIFRTVGTNAVDASVAITEHGIFSQAATGGGTLFDRSMFSGSTINMVNGDSLSSTYDWTASAGG